MKELLHRIQGLESRILLLVEKLEAMKATNEILSKENIRLNQQILKLKENNEGLIPELNPERAKVPEGADKGKILLLKRELDKSIEELDICLEKLQSK